MIIITLICHLKNLCRKVCPKFIQPCHNAPAAAQEITGEKYFLIAYCIWIGFSNKETAMAASFTESTIITCRKKFKNILLAPAVLPP
jgi:hypothetical protein